MVSIRCVGSFLWDITITIMLVNSVVQTYRVNAVDRYRRQLTTSVPKSRTNMRVDSQDLPVTHPCYPFVNVSDHVFYSPGYPAETYPNNTECVVVLQAPAGYLIKLDFRDWFAVEASPECKNDYLEVRDGAHGYNTILNKPFCGFDFPPMLTSSDRYLWIHFRSDENIEYRGFKAVFEYVPRPTTLTTPEIIPCRIDLSDMEEGVFGKSDIPADIIKFNEKWAMPTDCIWAITVKENWRVQLQFQKFSLEKPNDCESNFVEVFSDRTDMPSLEKNFCGSIADTVLSQHNVMFIRFYAEAGSTRSNFEANFTAFRDYTKTERSFKAGCVEGEFDCEDATCISDTLKCNGRYNCRFRWDEDDCQTIKSLALTDDHIIIIMVIFTLILTGMCFTFIYNCVKKLIRDHHTIQEYIRQSREHQLNELDKQDQINKILQSKSMGRSRSHSIDSTKFGSSVNPPCYVPGGEILPILIRNEHGSPNGEAFIHQDIYTVDSIVPETCDSACQTRESLFLQDQSSGHSTPCKSMHNSPPAPFSTFGYKKEKLKVEARLEIPYLTKLEEEKRRQQNKSAPDVIVTH